MFSIITCKFLRLGRVRYKKSVMARKKRLKMPQIVYVNLRVLLKLRKSAAVLQRPSRGPR